MKMFIIIDVIFVVMVLLYAGNTTISFSPFRIEMETWHRPVAIILAIIAFVFYDTFEGKHNYRKGFKAGIEQVENILKEKD